MKPPFAEFYLHWLTAEPRDVPQEKGLNCQRCLMVQPDRFQGALWRDPGPFREDLKCCTYFPFLPNFTIGALLTAASQRNLGRITAALAKGIATPLGLFSPFAQKKENFGQDPEALCPLFDQESRACSIWGHRPGVCASYVCKSSNGAEGLRAWAALEEKLNLFEWTLAHEVLWQLGFTQDETTAMAELSSTDRKTDVVEDQGLVRGLWAEHIARQEEFYRSCFAKALSVTPAEIAFLMR